MDVSNFFWNLPFQYTVLKYFLRFLVFYKFRLLIFGIFAVTKSTIVKTEKHIL